MPAPHQFVPVLSFIGKAADFIFDSSCFALRLPSIESKVAAAALTNGVASEVPLTFLV